MKKCYGETNRQAIQKRPRANVFDLCVRVCELGICFVIRKIARVARFPDGNGVEQNLLSATPKVPIYHPEQNALA